MLADAADRKPSIGAFSQHLHASGESRLALLSFIAQELPRWRDRADRPARTAETALTSQLCAHLNSVARRMRGWDCYQFRVEEGDEVKAGRKLDLVVSPCDAVLWIEGRSYTDFDTILPIECKRLPTPKGPNRDEREYVTVAGGSTGGIQRFKDGHHASAHTIGGIIAYLQADSHDAWHLKVQSWIGDLVASRQIGWSTADLLQFEADFSTDGLRIYRSSHFRGDGLANIELRHLWLYMS